MSREVIQEFLSSMGVVGIALTNRRMRPYFYGLDTVMDRTKQALGQGVLQVVENVPDGFESFEFHFAGHVVFIYKLKHGLVLLVLTDSDLKAVEYRRGITKIKYLLETDTYNTVAHFKLLLGSVTQHSLPSNSWNATSPTEIPQPQSTTQNLTNSVATPATKVPSQNAAAIASTTRSNTQTAPSQRQSTVTPSTPTPSRTQPNISKPQVPPASAKPSPIAETTTANNNLAAATSSNKSVSAKTDTQEYKLDELLEALNKLSEFTTQYLGKVVVTNYWKSSRPQTAAWLTEIEIDRSGHLSHPKQKAIACNLDQHHQIQEWVTSYVKRCKQVIRNFDQMLEQDCLTSRQKQILF
ncbi:hypothetical protein HCU40_04900 [Pseudanabaena biceps]|nr:hypothetical protein [Pseudanabaena biceps]